MRFFFLNFVLKIHLPFYLFIYLNTGEESTMNVTNHIVGNLILLTGTFHQDNNFQ